MAGFEEYPPKKPYRYDPHEIWNENYRFNNPKGDNNLSQQLEAVTLTDDQSPPPEDGEVKKYIEVSIGIVSLITENLLSHPFVVLRRQCQVHYNSKRFHLVPVTLIPVIIHLHQRQGITTLWKGVGSILLVRGMTLAVEDLISKITPWPKEIHWHNSFKTFSQHIMLKCVSLSIITPFYSASLVETVQSDIASEKPGVLDVFKEGSVRLLSWSSPHKGRMLPIWALVVPTVSIGVAKYIIGMIIHGTASRFIQAKQRRNQQSKGALSKELSPSSTQEIELNSALIAMITTDVLFYPLETILHRLHLQGTRTIVDNLDTGYSVLPILTNYEGVSDCYEKAISTEGVLGLYKGFGALIFQFVVHVAVIRLTKVVLTEVSEFLRPRPKPVVVNKNPNLVEPYPNPYAPNETYLIP